VLRFIHLTDTHIGPTEAFELYGKQPLPILRRVIDEINRLDFPIDFVLHTGDVVDDGSAEAYELYRDAIDELRYPVHHVVGNHDHVERLQMQVMDIDEPTDRLDYAFEAGGVRFLILDSRGPQDPCGLLQPEQLDWLRAECTPAGPPLVIAVHHALVPLDTPWLDTPPPNWGDTGRHMYTDNAAEVRAALAPARERIRAVLSGHVHGSFDVMRDGILYSAALSTFAPLRTLPSTIKVDADDTQGGMYRIVTVTDEQIIIRPRRVPLG
jgi:3',5'-cyclic-AMP phosphodiesterase